MSSDHIVVQTTFDNQAKADEKAKGLENRFQAIDVRQVDVTSVCWWLGKFTVAQEIVLTAKIDASDFAEAEKYISFEHGYTLPCVIAFDAVVKEEDAQQNWPTNFVLAQTMFNSEAAAIAAANDLVNCKLVACSKYWPTSLDATASTNSVPYCFSIETTREKLEEINALMLVGKSAPFSLKPIVAGKEKFLEWIQDCVAPGTKSALAQVLSDAVAIASSQPLDNHP